MSTLLPVINATGIAIHTNLGRSPISKAVFEEVQQQASGYTTVEYSVEAKRRGHRSVHLKETMTELTGAESCAVVNNNAAAVLLVLQALSANREVLVSRGELIEIGGSFRIPDIMNDSGCTMVEVGSTNITTIEDYERAISPNTGLIFKAHHSNFIMGGHVEEVSLEELVKLSKKHSIPIYYDLGSGLLKKPNLLKDIPEIDIRTAVSMGVDIISFSTDKLFGGLQGGVIIGAKELVEQCERMPIMRALRVGKVALAALKSIADGYLSTDTIKEKNALYAILDQSEEEIQKRAQSLYKMINRKITNRCEVYTNKAQVGGGTLPYFFINSHAVKVLPPEKSVKKREAFAEALFRYLHELPKPIIAILKEGFVFFDMLTVEDADLPTITKAVVAFIKNYSYKE